MTCGQRRPRDGNLVIGSAPDPAETARPGPSRTITLRRWARSALYRSWGESWCSRHGSLIVLYTG